MIEEIEQLISKIKGSISLVNVRIGLFDIQGNILYSSLSESAADLAAKLTKSVFEAWDIGDYQVKHLPIGNLIISRVSEKLALAIDSYEREGLLIVTMGALLKKFGEDFKRIDSLLPGKPVPEKVEAPAPPTPEQVVEAPPKPPEPKAEKAVFSPSIEISPDAIFIVSEPNVNRVELDADMLALLRVIDGVKTVREVAKAAKVPLEKALLKIAYLVENRILSIVPRPEEDLIKYQRVYELVPPYTVDNVANKACAGRSSEVVTIMTNLDKNYTVMDLWRGLKKVGMEKSYKEILEILDYYARIGVTRVKSIGNKEIPKEWLENEEYKAVYEYAPGQNCEKALKTLVIGDRKYLIVLRNLDEGYSVLELAQGMLSMGIDVTPEDVLKILKDLESRGIVRRKQ
ncbi:MAG: hypothetical protein ACTSSJ_02450 [Candidatus Odinarchaeia archaeon]